MAIWKSKPFWVLVGSGQAYAGLVAYDRYRVNAIMGEYCKEAEHFGSVPVRDLEKLPKVTILNFADDPVASSRQKKLFRQYSVQLLTKAGIDYNWLGFDSLQLDRAVDQLIPVPEGQPPPTDKATPKIVSVENWIIPLVASLMKTASGYFTKASPPKVEFVAQDPAQIALDKVLEEKLGSIRVDSNFPADGLVCCSQSVLECSAAGIARARQSITSDYPNRISLALLPLEHGQSWYVRIFNYFRKRHFARKIGEATMKIIREEYKPSKVSDIVPDLAGGSQPIWLCK